jgi:hypothetical protein
MKADKIAIGLRVGQMIDPAFFVSWTEMLMDGIRPGDKVLMPAVGMPHSCAANTLCERFLRTDCDALLFLDDDMVFTPGDVAAIRGSVTNHGILTGLYTTRREPVKPIALWWNGEAYAGKESSELRGIIDCDVVGLGFTLVSRAVIEEVAKLRGKTGIFTWSNTHGEDGDFCVLAAQLGYKVGVNCNVVIGHRVTYTSRWSAEENAVEMAIEHFGMNRKQQKEKEG